MEGVVWAFPASYGVLLNAYIRDPKFVSQSDAADLLPQIGSIASGLMHLLSMLLSLFKLIAPLTCAVPLLMPFLNRYPSHRRSCIYLGFVFTVGSLIGASFASRVSDLLILQGLVYAIGGGRTIRTFLFYIIAEYIS